MDLKRSTARLLEFYVDGGWVTPGGKERLGFENPATEEVVAELALGTAADVDRAVSAARAAFDGYAATTLAQRLELLLRLRNAYERRLDEIAAAITLEMGAPARMAGPEQAGSALAHLDATIEAAGRFPWDRIQGSTRIVHEPIGVCGLITPWNWPVSQVVAKVAPALAAGCTMVLKPSEIAPLSAALFAEVCHEAGVPRGVFTLVHGLGPVAGAQLAAHPQIDMMSFTGSTRAGTSIAVAAAPTVKRVAQELGGKSANLLLPEADLAPAVSAGVAACFFNTGQNCDAPSRMLVPRALLGQACELARAAAEALVTGDPRDSRTELGPLASQVQFDKVQQVIGRAIDDGARLVTGGLGRPQGLKQGWFVRPTVFGDVRNDMPIAREEVFGPVLSILPYATVDEAVAIANDSSYGLAAYVQGPPEEASGIARRLRAGRVVINGAGEDLHAPFGGYRQSGNGREFGEWGIREFCEVKAILGDTG
jgi:aldehyde dehydrogenase (NAD+)